MAEILGKLKPTSELIDFLQFQKKRLDFVADMWESVWNFEENLIDNAQTRLDEINDWMNEALTVIQNLAGADESAPVRGVGFEIGLLKGQYACPLEAGKLFSNWNIAAITLTIEGADDRISDIGTDTSNRFAATAKICISNAEDPSNNGIHTLTTVSGLVLTASGSTFTVNASDTKMIVTLIETA